MEELIGLGLSAFGSRAGPGPLRRASPSVTLHPPRLRLLTGALLVGGGGSSSSLQASPSSATALAPAPAAPPRGATAPPAKLLGASMKSTMDPVPRSAYRTCEAAFVVSKGAPAASHSSGGAGAVRPHGGGVQVRMAQSPPPEKTLTSPDDAVAQWTSPKCPLSSCSSWPLYRLYTRTASAEGK
eukprot:scaffold12954_cov105-Isochrysis_galbana.AAC.4